MNEFIISTSKLLKFYILILFLIIFTSCSSLYDSLKIKKVTKIKISKFDNYYESFPVSEVVILNKDDIKQIITPLKKLPIKSELQKDFHNFTSHKIIVELISANKSVRIFIIDNRLETNKYMFYSKIKPWEERFISIINSY